MSECHDDKLIEILRDKEVDSVRDFFKTMNKADRQEIAPRIYQLYIDAHAHRVVNTALWDIIGPEPQMSEEFKQFTSSANTMFELLPGLQECSSQIDQWKEKLRHYQKNTILALIATAAKETLEKRKVYLSRDEYCVLFDRHPSWMNEYIDIFAYKDLKCELYLEGQYEIPVSTEATCFFLEHTNYFGIALADAIRKYPRLVDEVWRFFALPGQVLHENEKYRSKEHRWSEAIITLGKQGFLDKIRILKLTHDIIDNADLSLDQSIHWPCSIHKKLGVKANDILPFIDSYFQWSQNPHQALSQFGFNMLLLAAKESKRYDSELLELLDAPLREKSKDRAMKATTLLETILLRSNSLNRKTLSLLLLAMEHENADIQTTAFKILSKHFDLNEVEIANALQRIASFLAPSVQSQLPIFSNTSDTKDHPDSKNIDYSPMISCSAYANLASIPEARNVLETGSDYIPPVKFNGMDVPRLYPENSLVSVSSVRELVDLMLKHLEHPFDFVDFERIIDGIARLNENRDEEFERNVGPIHKWFQKNEFHWPWLDVIEAWADGDFKTTLGFGSNEIDPFGAYRCWCNMVDRIYRMRRQHGPFQPLSTPTHGGGWIDPAIFVKRLCDNIETLDRYDIYDKITALLRLAPDNRAQALAKLDSFANSQHGYLNAVRYALGALDVSIDKIEPEWAHAPIWAAASRARNPFADDPFIASRIPELGSGTAQLPDCNTLLTREIDWSHVPFLPQAYSVKFDSPLKPESDHDLYLSVQLCKFRPPQGISYFHLYDLWPGNPVPYHLAAISFLAEGMNSNSYDESKTLAIARMNDPNFPWSKEAAMHLALGLVCSAPRAKTIAADIAIAMMNDGRFSDTDFADAIVQLLPFAQKIEIPESLKDRRQLRYGGNIEDFRLVPSRWAKCFATIAKESPLHAQYIRRIIERIICSLPDKDVGTFLETLHELCLESGEVVEHEETRRFLASLKGTGKAAKTGKKLLDLSRNEALSRNHRRHAAERALQGRTERVKRWMALSPEE